MALFRYMDKPQMSLSEIEEEKRATKIIRDVFGIKKSDIGAFRSAVKRAGNRVFIIVHPYFDKYERRKSEEIHPNSARAMQRINTFISNPSAHKPPIIILEEHFRVSNTKRHIRDTAGRLSINGTYFIPTRKADPTPEFTFDSPDGPTKGLWEDVIGALRALGVQKILLGGTYLHMSGSMDPKYVRGCVNLTWRQLARNFDVQISSFVGPARRQDVI